jgi:hypothetical protein
VARRLDLPIGAGSRPARIVDVKRVLLVLGLIVSILFLLLSLAALLVSAMSMGGGSFIALPLLTAVVGVVATTAFTRALRSA